MKKVFIEHSSNAYEQLFISLGFAITHNVDEAQLVCFTGGEDVSPGVYGDAQHKYTGCNPYRDQKEARLFFHCVEKSLPMVGICRGGQFLNVMSGGRMYQHVTKHTGSHWITDARSGETIYVSSTHHQMMMMGSEAVLVASSTLLGEREWYDNNIFRKDVSDLDVEVVFYKDKKALCFQPHPEFDDVEYKRMREYFRELINEFLAV